MVVWSSQSLRTAGKGNFQYHKLHRIVIPHISVFFPECGMTVILPFQDIPSCNEKSLFHSEKGADVVNSVCGCHHLKIPGETRD